MTQTIEPAKFTVQGCDGLMQIIRALDDLAEIYSEGAGEASMTGEEDYELRDLRICNILTKARNDVMAEVRRSAPENYFPRQTKADPRLLTAARDEIRRLQRALDQSRIECDRLREANAAIG